MLEQGKDFIQELAGQEDGRIAPKNNRLVGAWLPGSFMDQRLGENKVARDQPQLIQGIRRRDGVGEGQETTA